MPAHRNYQNQLKVLIYKFIRMIPVMCGKRTLCLCRYVEPPRGPHSAGLSPVATAQAAFNPFTCCTLLRRSAPALQSTIISRFARVVIQISYRVPVLFVIWTLYRRYFFIPFFIFLFAINPTFSPESAPSSSLDDPQNALSEWFLSPEEDTQVVIISCFCTVYAATEFTAVIIHTCAVKKKDTRKYHNESWWVPRILYCTLLHVML